jgi:hypothetical protein
MIKIPTTTVSPLEQIENKNFTYHANEEIEVKKLAVIKRLYIFQVPVP